MAYMQCPECKLTVPATATYLRGDQCPGGGESENPQASLQSNQPVVGKRQ